MEVVDAQKSEEQSRESGMGSEEAATFFRVSVAVGRVVG